MRRILEILTPENVHIEYELAGLGSRFVALVIDYLVQGALIVLLAVSVLAGGIKPDKLDLGSSLVISAGIVLLFLLLFGYFIFFEMVMNGQSPGKKAMKLRVLKYNGEPLGFLDSFLRNVLRMADMLPFLNLVGAIFIMFTKHYRRIGDFAANTIVVKVKKEERPVSAESALRSFSDGAGEQPANLYPVDNYEYSILKDFLARQDALGEKRPVFEHQLSDYFVKKFNIEIPPENPVRFLEEILKMNMGK